MNELRQELHELSDHLIVYGEGWKMHSSNLLDRMAHMQNKHVLYTIGFFNDVFRETIKGKTFGVLEKGYATGNPEAVDIVAELMLGSARNRFMFKYASQSVNYVECHDNLTFHDQAMQMSHNSKLAKRQQKLATAMVILAQGVPFIHMGQEFYRSKMNIDNTYQSGDSINKIHWESVDSYIDDIDFIRKLIEIRKKYSCFWLRSSSELNQEASLAVSPSKTLIIRYDLKAGLYLIFKPLDGSETINIPDDYNLLLSSTDSFQKTAEGLYLFRELGTYIFIKEGM
jgi:pullulanase